MLFLGVFTSCTSYSSAIVSDAFIARENTSPVEPPGGPFEKELSIKAPSPPQKLPSIERAIQMVKQNSPEITKYFIIEKDAHLTVKADLKEVIENTGEIEHFEVVYDLKHALPMNAQGDPRWWVPFFVKATKTGVVQHDGFQWHIQEDAAGILLAFDDDYQEVWERNLDMFDRYGAKVTFFLTGEFCSFCQTALNRGHDVGYHTIHHLNLLKVSREVFFQETISLIDTFRNEGIPLNSFAYPFGFSEPWMHEELIKFFKIQRGYGVTFRVYDRETIQKGYISSIAIDNILYKKDEDFEAMIRIMLRTIKFIGGEQILPLTTHTISDTADWGIKPHRLAYLLQTVKDLHLKFYRYKDF
jgi:hypothetical protein